MRSLVQMHAIKAAMMLIIKLKYYTIIYYTKMAKVKNAFRHHAFPKRGVVEKTLKGILIVKSIYIEGSTWQKIQKGKNNETILCENEVEEQKSRYRKGMGN